MFIAVLVFVLILGVLVLVHELGHFVTARRNGVRASEFGFGFPPRIFGFQFLYNEGIDKNKTKVRGKWRIIWGSKDGDDENEKADLKEAHEKKMRAGTIYSLNWIPLGGFVRIKGEDGENRSDPDSFSNKSAWVRIKILSAGVVMNFVLAWFLLSICFIIGSPEEINPNSGENLNSKIQISEIISGAPGSTMGIRVGDEISKIQKNSAGQTVYLQNIKAVQNYINQNKGQKISLDILRGSEKITVSGVPRVDAPQGQGALGIALAETALVRYPWYSALWRGIGAVRDMTIMILFGLYGILRGIFMGHGVVADVSGPIGIAILTKEVTSLGLVYIIQFAAILSVNLGIFNILPIPALDGGRVLFVLIEKIKGTPISQKVEQSFHTIFFVLLLLLMAVVTYKDIIKIF